MPIPSSSLVSATLTEAADAAAGRGASCPPLPTRCVAALPAPAAGGRAGLCLDPALAAPAGLLAPANLVVACLTLVAAAISAIGLIIHGNGLWQWLVPLLCVLAGGRVFLSLAGLRRSATHRQVSPCLWLGSDGSCLILDDRPAGPHVQPIGRGQAAIFEFGWHNARQARIRCRPVTGPSQEWRVCRARLDQRDWKWLCRWLVWQARGSGRC